MKNDALAMLIAITMTSGCTLGYNATHSHNWHQTHAAMQADAEQLRATGHRKMAAKLEREWDTTVGAPMWCMLGDMGLMMGGFGGLSIAQGLERRGAIEQSSIEPINLAGLATTAIVFASLGVSLLKYGHL